MTTPQRQELFRLLCGLLYVKTAIKFKMIHYGTKRRDDDPLDPHCIVNDCGTAACAFGHAPLFCKNKPMEDEKWWQYRERLLGISHCEDLVHEFMFDSDWMDSKTQAAARIYHFLLDGGVPKAFDPGRIGVAVYRKPTRKQVEVMSVKIGVPIDSVVSI